MRSMLEFTHFSNIAQNTLPEITCDRQTDSLPTGAGAALGGSA